MAVRREEAEAGFGRHLVLFERERDDGDGCERDARERGGEFALGRDAGCGNGAHDAVEVARFEFLPGLAESYVDPLRERVDDRAHPAAKTT